MSIYAGHEKLESTLEDNQKILDHMKKKFITERTPERFKARLIDLAGTLSQAATELETEDQTLGRWCNGKSKIPGVAWVALEGLEHRKMLDTVL